MLLWKFAGIDLVLLSSVIFSEALATAQVTSRVDIPRPKFHFYIFFSPQSVFPQCIKLQQKNNLHILGVLPRLQGNDVIKTYIKVLNSNLHMFKVNKVPTKGN